MKETSLNGHLNIKQKALLDLLVESDNIMTENGIRYALFGGSALGARRHHGFIPWDDDIDIIIDSENYYKLETLFKDGPIGRVNLVFFHNEPNWYRPFAMLVKTDDTCYGIPSLYTCGQATGTRIDVMICDYVPKEMLEAYQHDLMLYEESLMVTSLANPALHSCKEDYYNIKKRMKKEGKSSVEAELRKSLEAYSDLPNADQVVVRYWTRELRHYDRHDIFGDAREWFEGHLISVPLKLEKQLRQQYGYDWYIIPPPEERGSHLFFDNEYIPGINYHDDLMNFIDQNIGENAMLKIKRDRLESVPYSDRDAEFKRNLEAQRELMRSGINDEKKCNLILEWYKCNKYSEICCELQGLLSSIGSFKFVEKTHKCVPEDVMEAWLNSLIYCGHYYDVIRIASAFDLYNSSNCHDQIDLSLKIASLEAACQDNDLDLIEACLCAFSNEEKQKIPDYIIALFCLKKQDNDKKSAQVLLKMCNSYLAEVSDNFEVLKIKGDLIRRLGDENEAKKIYSVVSDNTKNGLLLLDLRENALNYDV